MEYLACSLDRIATTQALREQAETEPLTGLGNRRRLQRALEQHLSRAAALRRARRAAAARPRPVQGRERRARPRDRRRGDRRVRGGAARAHARVRRAGPARWRRVRRASRPSPTCSTRGGWPRTIREHIARRCNALLPPDWGLTATIGVAVYPGRGRRPGVAAARGRHRALPRQGLRPRRRGGRRARGRRHHGRAAPRRSRRGLDPAGMNSCSR